MGILDDAALTVGEIIPATGPIFDYAAKYQAGGAEEIFPADLTAEQARALVEQFRETAHYRKWTLIACAVMHNHVHVVIAAGSETPSADVASPRENTRSFTAPRDPQYHMR